MKFSTDSITRCAARIGTLSEFVRIPEATLETPTVLIYTKSGCVPHLTKDVLKRITTETQLLSVTLPSTITMWDSLKELQISFADFVSMPEYIHFLSIQDTGITNKVGTVQKDAVGIWSRNGRYKLVVDNYMDLIEAFKPDLYVALCDGDTNINSSKKRAEKAVHRSNSLLEGCLAKHMSSNTLKSTGILASVEGGYNLECRKDAIEYLKDKPVTGYVIDGLHTNGPDVQNIKSEQLKEIVNYTLNLLPAEKLKVSLGCWNPVMVLDLISLGVDLFDTTYTYVATENAQALTFLCNHDSCNNQTPLLSTSDQRYKEDFSPICKKCECLTCRNHTRAYLNHLYNTKEMLHSVLLMIHNTHQYLEFFRGIRESIKNDTFTAYREEITARFSREEDKSVPP